MNKIILKTFGFFIGLFITLFIINYMNIQKKKIENFEINKPSKETYTNLSSTPVSTPAPISSKIDFQLIPYKNHKYMCINTFFNIKQISNTEGRWYECELNNNEYNSDINEYHYFTFNKMINLKANTINNEEGSYGADINNIQLNGPKSFYFANNTYTNELNEFSMILSIKIKDITSKNNIIFEMTGNTETIKNDTIDYTFSMVNINIYLNDDNKYDFILTIGDVIYKGNINNIDRSVIKNSDFLIIGLIYTNSEITLLINKQMYKYKTIKNFTIKLGSTPVIINKEGLINMELFNFIYYKTILPINEYLNIFKHNYHYLSGLHSAISTNPNIITEKCDKEIVSNTLDIRLNELENKLGKCIQNNKENISNSELQEDDIKPFNIDIIDNIKTKTSNFFSFLF